MNTKFSDFYENTYVMPHRFKDTSFEISLMEKIYKYRKA